jgi:hypothetical protein
MGVSDSGEIKTQNDEWILCIADFEMDSIPNNRSSISNSIMRNLVESLNRISYRARISPEYAFYEEAAWTRARSDAAKAIAAKQNERSLLVYRGDPNWRYIRNIERIDAEIEKLRLALEEVENNVPLINSEPVFGLTTDNMEFKFPSAPVTGNEYRFCLDQKADALLTGSITGFHERFIVSLKLYTVYTQSFVWEDSIIFSYNDLENAMEEIMRRLLTVLSGNEPAVLTVRAEPEDTLVLINQSFAGRGQLEALEYPPGKITVTASAPNHESLTFETELFSAEKINITIGLMPIEYGNVEIDGVVVGRIYNGALYIGETPLTLRLPLNQMEFIELETPGNARSSTVFQAFGDNEFNYSLAMPAAVPPSNGRVNKARRMYYWAWGSTWITGIAAWLTYYSYLNSYNVIRSNYNYSGAYDQSFYDSNTRMYYIRMGSIIALGVAVAFDIFFMSRYIYSANRGAASIAK